MFKKRKDLQSKIEELEKKIFVLDPSHRYATDFSNGENYFYVLDDSDIDSNKFDYGHKDYWRLNTNNAFKTVELAREKRRMQEVGIDIRAISKELNAEQKIDWFNREQKKYSLVYDWETETVFQRFTTVIAEPNIYCLDIRFKDICLDRIGVNDLKFYFKYRIANND